MKLKNYFCQSTSFECPDLTPLGYKGKYLSFLIRHSLIPKVTIGLALKFPVSFPEIPNFLHWNSQFPSLKFPISFLENPNFLSWNSQFPALKFQISFPKIPNFLPWNSQFPSLKFPISCLEIPSYFLPKGVFLSKCFWTIPSDDDSKSQRDFGDTKSSSWGLVWSSKKSVSCSSLQTIPAQPQGKTTPDPFLWKWRNSGKFVAQLTARVEN